VTIVICLAIRIAAVTASLVGHGEASVADGLTRSGASGGIDELAGGLAPLLIVLVVAGCVQGTVGQAGTQYAPYPPESNEIRSERGGGDGGGGRI
jgi:hypothetical protein